jgi:hypothetical protein
MKLRPLVSMIVAAAAAAALIYYAPTLYDVAPAFFRPENCQRCAHTIVFVALLLEAVAIWLHASREEKSIMLKVTAGMFCFSGILGLGSIVMETFPVA